MHFANNQLLLKSIQNIKKTHTLKIIINITTLKSLYIKFKQNVKNQILNLNLKEKQLQKLIKKNFFEKKQLKKKKDGKFIF